MALEFGYWWLSICLELAAGLLHALLATTGNRILCFLLCAKQFTGVCKSFTRNKTDSTSKETKRNVGVLTYLQVQKKMSSPWPRLLKTIAHFHLMAVCPLRKDIHKFLYCLPTMPFALFSCYSWRRREAPHFMWKRSASYSVTMSCKQGEELRFLVAENINEPYFTSVFPTRTSCYRWKCPFPCLRKHYQYRLRIKYFITDANISWLVHNSVWLSNYIL